MQQLRLFVSFFQIKGYWPKSAIEIFLFRDENTKEPELEPITELEFKPKIWLSDKIIHWNYPRENVKNYTIYLNDEVFVKLNGEINYFDLGENAVMGCEIKIRAHEDLGDSQFSDPVTLEIINCDPPQPEIISQNSEITDESFEQENNEPNEIQHEKNSPDIVKSAKPYLDADVPFSRSHIIDCRVRGSFQNFIDYFYQKFRLQNFCDKFKRQQLQITQ